MTALTIDGITLTQTSAAELLALSPDVPADMTTDAALNAIHLVLVSHGGNLDACVEDLLQEYGDHMDSMCWRMTRCAIVAARLTGVTP
jgi:hypothetical protein